MEEDVKKQNESSLTDEEIRVASVAEAVKIYSLGRSREENYSYMDIAYKIYRFIKFGEK